MRRSAILLLALAGFAPVTVHAADARATLERYLSRALAVQIRDLTLDQDLTVFSPDGRAPFASGTQRVVFRFPDRQRVEQIIEGRTEVRITVGSQTWRRGFDGKIATLPPERGQGVALAVPVHRTADEVLAEWRALGIRDDRFHEARLSGRRVVVVGALVGERDRLAVWLDPEYGVMRLVAREQSDAGTVFTDVSFSDYRPLLSGFFFPHREEIFRSGKLLARERK